MEVYGIPCSYIDESNLWHEFFSYIESSFPYSELALSLTELNLQTAKNVQVSFFQQNDAVWDNKDHPLSTFKKPFVNILLLSFEDYDDFKKSGGFDKVYTFVTSNTRINEWMIVYYPNVVINNEISYKSIRKNFERLRLDFIDFLQDADSDRILKFFEYMPEKKNDVIVKDECIEEFKKCMKSCLEASIQKRITYILKELEASFDLRENPEWDYLQFFALKENLALVLEMLNLYMDCLQQYDELRNLLFETKHKSTIKFSTSLNFKNEPINENLDSINPLLMNYSKLPFRFLIYNNKISEFMFLQYVFARKLYLLKKMDMDFEAIERFKFFIKEVKRIFEGKTKFFSILIDDDNEQHNALFFEIFCHVWVYQISNGLAQIYKNNLIQANAAKITALTNNIYYLKNLAKFHLQKMGVLLYNLHSDFFKFDSLEASLQRLSQAMMQDASEQQQNVEGNQEYFEKFYSRLFVVHDKELYLSLKSKDSYFNLLFKCYSEIKSISLLNYNRRQSFWNQVDALNLAIKSKKIGENPNDYADLSMKILKNWKELELRIKLIFSTYLLLAKNWKQFVKCLLSLLTVKSKEFSDLYQLFLQVVEKTFEQRIELKKLDVFSLDEVLVRQNSDHEISVKLKIHSKIHLEGGFPCGLTAVLEDKNPEKTVKKIELGNFELKNGENQIELNKTIDFYGFFKVTEILLHFSKIDIRLPDDDETILIFQKNLRLGDLEIKDFATMEPLSTLDIFCQNVNKYLVTISNIGFEFSSLMISLDSKKQSTIFSIPELVLFFKDGQNQRKLPLNLTEEDGRLFFKTQLSEAISNLERIYFFLVIDARQISSTSKEEISLNIEFYDKEALTCILEQCCELNFERIFEIKFNHYSNPLFSFSNIQLKNLSLYSFSMLAFYLDNEQIQSMEKRMLNPLETMGIILKNQSLNISSGFFEFLLSYNERKKTTNSPECTFLANFNSDIEEYMNRKLHWRLPEKFLFDLTKTHKLRFLFHIEVEASKTFFVGTPGRLRFIIKRNLEETITTFNRENVDYFLSLENFSSNWLVIGSFQKKFEVFEEEREICVDFTILPLNVGHIELPKFQIVSKRNNILLMAPEMKSEDLERIENESKLAVKNNELLVYYVNGNNVLVCSYEKTKAEYAVFV